MIKTALILLVPIFILTGCSNPKEMLGLNKHSPDEFAVIKRAPLSMPKDYTLRPPKTGTPRPQKQTPTDQAKRAVFSVEQQHVESGENNGLEGILLKKAHAQNTPANIRQTVEKETRSFSLKEKPVAEKLLFWKEDIPDAVEINPTEETKRLEDELKTTGQTVKLPTAVIERRTKE